MGHDRHIELGEDPAGALSRMVVDTAYETIPGPVIDLAKKAILDTLAVTIAGSSWEVVPAIVEQVVEWGGAPQSRVLVYGHRLPAPSAAFANGVMARSIDMGDVHETGGHVSEWNVPAMMTALGIAGGPVTGRDFLASYVTGSELGVRSSAALRLVQNHTTWGMPGEWNGPLCATASVARLLGLSVEHTWNALGIAYTVHSQSEHSKYSEGTQMARVQHSFAADTAIKACLLTRRGITAPKGIFWGKPSGILRHIAWEHIEPELLTEELGTRWHYAEGLSMKPYPACKFTHSFIASTIELMRRHDLDHRRIAKIDCRSSNASRMTFEPAVAKWSPRTTPEAMFSAPYTIATAAIDGQFFLADLHPDAIIRPDKLDLMRRISITADPAITDDFEGFPVEITMLDGTVHRHTTPYTKGHTRNPMSWDDLTEKLHRCAGYAAVKLPDEKLATLVELCRNLDTVADAGALVDAMIA